MDDNRGGKGYFGLENGGISVFALESARHHLTGQPRVARDIGSENGGQPAFEVSRGH